MPVTTPPPGPAIRAEALLRRADARLATPRWRRLVAGLNALLLVVAVAPFVIWEGFGPARFDAVELGQHPDRVPRQADAPIAEPGPGRTEGWSPAALPYDLSPSTVVTLVFSVGSRDLDPQEAARLRVHDVADRGGDGLTDSMMLVVADHATQDVALLSIPRDLWLHDRGHRINATFNRAGLQAFVDDVARTAGLPIHHVVQLNFGAFARLVDAVGGVAMPVDRPLADVPAVLYVPEAGCWHFDGAAALAWARGRHTLTRDADGDWVVDASASDFGRIDRQQALLGAIWDQVRSPGAIASLPRLFSVARQGMVVDDGLGVQQVRDLLDVFGEVASGEVEGHTLPTRGQRIGGAAAQVVDVPAATEVLTRLRTWPPAAGAARGPATADTTVVAAPASLALPAPTGCTTGAARPLPDPRPPLGGVAASRAGDGPASPSATTPTEDPSVGTPPPRTPTTEPSTAPEASPTPSSGTASDPPSDPPSTSPSPSPSEEADEWDLPLPGWNGSGG